MKGIFTDSQTQRMDLWLPRAGGKDEAFGMSRVKLSYIGWINKVPPYDGSAGERICLQFTHATEWVGYRFKKCGKLYILRKYVLLAFCFRVYVNLCVFLTLLYWYYFVLVIKVTVKQMFYPKCTNQFQKMIGILWLPFI